MVFVELFVVGGIGCNDGEGIIVWVLFCCAWDG
jgi:hypothetical protein